MSDKNVIDTDPANEGDLAGTLRSVFRKFLQNVDGMLPAEVIAYDRVTNMATVRPLINVLTSNGDSVARAQVASIPVLALGAGNFVINFPVKQGNKGWIEASDRDISLFLQNGNAAIPNDMRFHAFEFGRFIPDVFGAFTIDEEDMDSSMVIQTLDGATKISLSDTKIKLKSANIDLEGILIINGAPYLSHAHGGVESGSSNSGGVVS